MVLFLPSFLAALAIGMPVAFALGIIAVGYILISGQVPLNVVPTVIFGGMDSYPLLAIPFFGFNLWGLGLVLAAFFMNLMLTAWAVALLVSGIVLRHGLGAEAFAWSLMFVMLPLVCVYYPVTLLPGWLQPVAWALPPTYVFEGMRAALAEHVFRVDLMVWALGINALLIAGGALAFLWLLQSARIAGTLLQGE